MNRALSQYLKLNGQQVTKPELRRLQKQMLDIPRNERDEATKLAIRDIDYKLNKEGRLGTLKIGKKLSATLFDQGAAQSDMFSQRPATKQPEQPAWYAELLRNGFTVADIQFFEKELTSEYNERTFKGEVRQFQTWTYKGGQGIADATDLNEIVAVLQKYRVWNAKNGNGDNVNARRLVEIFGDLAKVASKSRSGEISFEKLPKKQTKEITALLDQLTPQRQTTAPEPPKAEPKPRGRKPKPQTSTVAPEPHSPPQPAQGKTFAVWMNLDDIKTDPKRFQNRIDSFSEASARSVAESLDWNIFDPIVVWKDPKNGVTYVLSGHSRYEGLRRRGEPQAPVRYYEGSEAEAIQFARIQANRTATAESLVEDLRAYKLARDGDTAKGIPPLKKSVLQRDFKGKWQKLEDLSFLDPVGSFIGMLASENVSEFPYAERLSRWVGQLRKTYPEITNDMERNIWEWTYDDSAKGYKLDEATFKGTIEQRLSTGRELLFDCYSGKCDKETKTLEEFLKTSEERKLQRVVKELDQNLKRVRERLKINKGNPDAIYTDEERQYFRNWGKELEEKRATLITETTKAMRDQKALFGASKRQNATKRKR